jgi:DUF4097 and DUF4098 domain-containing protein YvlB
VVNKAQAKVNATLATNLAQMESYLQVTKSEATAYKAMKQNLGFTTDKQLLDYIKVKTINGFSPSKLLVGLN